MESEYPRLGHGSTQGQPHVVLLDELNTLFALCYASKGRDGIQIEPTSTQTYECFLSLVPRNVSNLQGDGSARGTWVTPLNLQSLPKVLSFYDVPCQCLIMATASCLTSVDEEHSNYQKISEQLFPGCRTQLLANQGACSTTFALEYTQNGSVHHRVLQFRESCFALDTDIVAEAKRTYRDYAPSTKQHALPFLSTGNGRVPSTSCYEMEVILGLPLNTIAPTGPSLSQSELKRQENLVQGFADFVSRGWPKSGINQPACNGKVGSQIPQKLKLLTERLPYRQHRAVAQKALDEFDSISRLPIALNHGDILPSNIICDPETGHLNGVVDWAEAEYLPFGICLYGLEPLLGRMALPSRRDSVMGCQPFVYYDCATDLRRLFWRTLGSKIPALQNDESLMKLVILARTIGTLLWYGFAWDGGAIDRVVNTERDVQELVYLDAFLDDKHDSASLS
jgi:hypothetical protein